MTHLEVFDNNNLRKDEENEPAEDNDEIPPPQILHIQRIPSRDIIRSTDGARPRLRTVEGASLIRPDDIGVLVHPRAVAGDNKSTVTNQGNPRKLGLHNTRPRVGEGIEVVNPKQPPLHQEFGNEVSRVLDDVGDEDDRHTEGGVEVLEAETKGAEEALHREIGEVGDKVERPEGSR